MLGLPRPGASDACTGAGGRRGPGRWAVEADASPLQWPPEMGPDGKQGPPVLAPPLPGAPALAHQLVWGLPCLQPHGRRLAGSLAVPAVPPAWQPCCHARGSLTSCLTARPGPGA